MRTGERVGGGWRDTHMWVLEREWEGVGEIHTCE